MEAYFSLGIFFLTLFLVIKQPKGLDIGWSSFIGFLLSVIFKTVSFKDIFYVVSIVWDASLAFLGIIFISLVLDKIGFFEWASLKVIELSKGSGKLLFFNVMLLTAITSAFFANDGAALIITPIVYSKIKHLNLREEKIFPLVMGSGFIADSTSIVFVTSNLVNILTADFFQIGFVSYFSKMFFVNMVSFLISVLFLYLYYKKDIIDSYDVNILEDKRPQDAIKDKFLFRWSFVIGIFMMIGFVLSEIYKIPLSFVMSLGAVSIFLLSFKNKALDYKKLIFKETPWKIVFFSVFMYVVVYSLKNANVINLIYYFESFLISKGDLVGIIGTGYLSAILSSIMNNLPSVMIVNLGIQNVGYHLKEALALSNVIGCDIGPKMTPIGSLATLIWLHILEKKGIKINIFYYMKVGILISLPVLFFTLLTLYFVYKL